jgi:hypothetical protein
VVIPLPNGKKATNLWAIRRRISKSTMLGYDIVSETEQVWA